MLETRVDQANGLRRLAASKAPSVIAVTGGKGGVGKTHVSANLAYAFQRAGRQTLLLDADLGLANLDVVMGLRARLNLEHVVSGHCDLADVLLTGPAGLRLVPASSGSSAMANLDERSTAGLVHSFSALLEPIDVLLIDTPAGIGPGVLTFGQAAHDVLVVVCDEPAALTDAYGLIKALSLRDPRTRFQILANRVVRPGSGRDLFAKLARVVDRFLDARLGYWGEVPEDPYLVRSARRQTLVSEAFPSSPSSQAFKKLAQRADKEITAEGVRGHLEFFVERLLGVSTLCQEDSLQ